MLGQEDKNKKFTIQILAKNEVFDSIVRHNARISKRERFFWIPKICLFHVQSQAKETWVTEFSLSYSLGRVEDVT